MIAITRDRVKGRKLQRPNTKKRKRKEKEGGKGENIQQTMIR
jgi:hypothetical protein